MIEMFRGSIRAEKREQRKIHRTMTVFWLWIAFLLASKVSRAMVDASLRSRPGAFLIAMVLLPGVAWAATMSPIVGLLSLPAAAAITSMLLFWPADIDGTVEFFRNKFPDLRRRSAECSEHIRKLELKLTQEQDRIREERRKADLAASAANTSSAIIPAPSVTGATNRESRRLRADLGMLIGFLFLLMSAGAGCYYGLLNYGYGGGIAGFCGGLFIAWAIVFAFTDFLELLKPEDSDALFFVNLLLILEGRDPIKSRSETAGCGCLVVLAVAVGVAYATWEFWGIGK